MKSNKKALKELMKDSEELNLYDMKKLSYKTRILGLFAIPVLLVIALIAYHDTKKDRKDQKGV
jgi:hypothetical protein